MLIRLSIACLMTLASLAYAAEGFVPELRKIEISDSVLAPGDTFELRTQWANVGSAPSISHLIPVIHFRLGDVGFINTDGGLWVDGNTFHKPCCLTTPTTAWQPGQLITEPPLQVQIPASAPNGIYRVYMGFYDRGGRYPLANTALLADVPYEAKPIYQVATITVSRDRGKAQSVPLVREFPSAAKAQEMPASDYLWKNQTNLAAGALPAWVRKPVRVGSGKLTVILDSDANYALAAFNIDGVIIDAGGLFPAITVFDASGARLELSAQNPGWKVQPEISESGALIHYVYDGFKMDVRYQITGDLLEATCTPIEETRYKALLLSGGGSAMFTAADRAKSKETSYILAPETGGKLIQFGNDGKLAYTGQLQSWVYPASFVAMGTNGKGLILRAPQLGAEWSYGKRWIHGQYGLYADTQVAFRPTSANFEMPRVEPSITFQFKAVADDVNGDGVVNWVDLGVAYRRAFIRGNLKLDTRLRDSFVGKIQVASPSQNYQTYNRLIEEVRAIDFAPQVWWLVGAHSPSNNGYVDPPYAAVPDESHNGPDGYDYFAFKRDAAKVGARIGIHELFPDISINSTVVDKRTGRIVRDFAQTPLRLDMNGQPTATWGGTNWICYSKAIHAMGENWFESIREHLAAWDVRPGDTWHWDCFTAVGGRQDYDPRHPATNGSDLRMRIKTLAFIQDQLGIPITSEGIQEGLVDHCSYSWSSQVEISPRTIPLLPVLFQGKTYYGFAWQPAYSLLMGGKPAYEQDHLDREGILQSHFSHNVFWSLIADRTIKNVITTPQGYRVEYDQGGELDVDLAGFTDKMTFRLTIDGKTYTPDNPPASANGTRAKWVDGRYVVTK